jgi:hypothetical protein
MRNPLVELFVVYNHSWRPRDPLTLRRELVFASNYLFVRAQYAFWYEAVTWGHTL